MPRRNLVPATIISFIVIRFWHERTTAQAHMEIDYIPAVWLQIEMLARQQVQTTFTKLE